MIFSAAFLLSWIGPQKYSAIFTKFSGNVNDIFTNWSDTDLNLKIYDISDTNYFDSNYSNPYLTLLPFTGDGEFGYDVEVAYVDTATTNFYLQGGTLLIGVGLFAAAIVFFLAAVLPHHSTVTELKERAETMQVQVTLIFHSHRYSARNFQQ